MCWIPKSCLSHKLFAFWDWGKKPVYLQSGLGSKHHLCSDSFSFWKLNRAFLCFQDQGGKSLCTQTWAWCLGGSWAGFGRHLQIEMTIWAWILHRHNVCQVAWQKFMPAAMGSPRSAKLPAKLPSRIWHFVVEVLKSTDCIEKQLKFCMAKPGQAKKWEKSKYFHCIRTKTIRNCWNQHTFLLLVF